MATPTKNGVAHSIGDFRGITIAVQPDAAHPEQGGGAPEAPVPPEPSRGATQQAPTTGSVDADNGAAGDKPDKPPPYGHTTPAVGEKAPPNEHTTVAPAAAAHPEQGGESVHPERSRGAPQAPANERPPDPRTTAASLPTTGPALLLMLLRSLVAAIPRLPRAPRLPSFLSGRPNALALLVAAVSAGVYGLTHFLPSLSSSPRVASVRMEPRRLESHVETPRAEPREVARPSVSREEPAPEGPMILKAPELQRPKPVYYPPTPAAGPAPHARPAAKKSPPPAEPNPRAQAPVARPLDPRHLAEAQKLYVEAYGEMEKNPNDAIAKFRRVIKMAGPDEPISIAANRWLREAEQQERR